LTESPRKGSKSLSTQHLGGPSTSAPTHPPVLVWVPIREAQATLDRYPRSRGGGGGYARTQCEEIPQTNPETLKKAVSLFSLRRCGPLVDILQTRQRLCALSC